MEGQMTLRERIAHWSSWGYVVTSETPTSAQLIRKRRFNPVEFVVMPIYLLEYLGQRDRSVYLAVAEDGSIAESGSGTERSRYQRLQDRSPLARLGIAVLFLVAFFAILVVVAAIFP